MSNAKPADGSPVDLRRWRVGALVRVHRHGTAAMAEMGRKGALASLSVYGASDAARSVRASDLAAFRRGMTDAEKRRLLVNRERQFGLEPGSLTSRLERGERAKP